MRGKGNRRTVTVGIWRNGSKDGIGAEKKPVELGNQEAKNGEVGGVAGERGREGWTKCVEMEELEELKMREAGKIK